MIPLSMSIEAAAERLGYPYTVGWLKKHVKDLPHVKLGTGSGKAGRVGFTEAHLAEILLMNEQRPGTVEPPSPESLGVRTRRRSA